MEPEGCASDHVDFFSVTSPLVAALEYFNITTGAATPVSLNGSVYSFDPDLPVGTQSRLFYNWTCVSVQTGLPCVLGGGTAFEPLLPAQVWKNSTQAVDLFDMYSSCPAWLSRSGDELCGTVAAESTHSDDSALSPLRLRRPSHSQLGSTEST